MVNARSTWFRPMNTGICRSIGRQLPSGLTPCSRWSFCISCAWRCRSFAYFFWTFFISGAKSCIFFIDRTWFTNGLNMMPRTVNVRKMMPRIQEMAEASPNAKPKTLCQHHKMKDTG